MDNTMPVSPITCEVGGNFIDITDDTRNYGQVRNEANPSKVKLTENTMDGVKRAKKGFLGNVMNFAAEKNEKKIGKYKRQIEGNTMNGNINMSLTPEQKRSIQKKTAKLERKIKILEGIDRWIRKGEKGVCHKPLKIKKTIFDYISMLYNGFCMLKFVLSSKNIVGGVDINDIHDAVENAFADQQQNNMNNKDQENQGEVSKQEKIQNYKGYHTNDIMIKTNKLVYDDNGNPIGVDSKFNTYGTVIANNGDGKVPYKINTNVHNYTDDYVVYNPKVENDFDDFDRIIPNEMEDSSNTDNFETFSDVNLPSAGNNFNDNAVVDVDVPYVELPNTELSAENNNNQDSLDNSSSLTAMAEQVRTLFDQAETMTAEVARAEEEAMATKEKADAAVKEQLAAAKLEEEEMKRLEATMAKIQATIANLKSTKEDLLQTKSKSEQLAANAAKQRQSTLERVNNVRSSIGDLVDRYENVNYPNVSESTKHKGK